MITLEPDGKTKKLARPSRNPTETLKLCVTLVETGGTLTIQSLMQAVEVMYIVTIVGLGTPAQEGRKTKQQFA